MCFSVLSSNMLLHHMRVWCLYQKRVLKPLEMELQIVVS